MAGNEGVVGILRAILTADTTSFDAGMKKAAAAPAAVEKSVAKLTDEVKKLAPQAERMVKSFGGDKLLYQANNLTAAVQKLGGAQKLTEAEQTRVNRTLTEAIAKYKLLGTEAPKAMLDIEKATRRLEQPTTLATHATGSLKTSFASLTSAFALSNVLTTVVTDLTAMSREAIASGARLVDLRDKTGLTLATLQRMEFVAGQSGDAMEGMTDAAFKLGARLAGGSGSVQKAVADLAKASGDLSLTFSKLRAESPDQQWEAVNAALNKVGNTAERNRLGVELFGKSFTGIAASVKAGYKEVADQALLSSDAQLEALDKAGDAWEAFKNRQQSYVRGILGTTVTAINELRKMTLSDVARAAIAASITGNGPGDMIGLLAGQATKKPFIGPPINPTGQAAAPPVPANYVTMLREAQKAVDALTAAQRAQIAAAIKMGASQDDQIALLDRFGISATTAEGVLKIFSAETKAAQKEVGDITKKYFSLTSALNATQDQVRNLTTAKRAEIDAGITLGITEEKIAEKLGISKEVVSAYADQVKAAAAFQAQMTVEIEKTIVAANKAAQEEGNRRALLRAESVIRSTVNIDKASDATAATARTIAVQRADFEAAQAERAGASWQMVFAMQQRAGQLRLDADLAAERQRFNDQTATLEEGSAEFNAYATEHNAKVQQMTEAFRQGEILKREELKHTHDVWGQRWKQLQAEIIGSTASSLSQMLVGLRGFKDGWLDVWRDIRQSLANILSQMLQDFLGYLTKLAIYGKAANITGGIGAGGGGGLTGSALMAGASRLGGLFGIGGGAAGTSAGAWALGAGTLTLDGSAAGAGAAAAAGGGAAGGGLGATIGGLATNPITIAAAGALVLGLGIWKKGWLRGGWEGVEGNKRRDQFVNQPAIGGFAGLQSKLTQAFIARKQPDAGNKADSLIKSLNRADQKRPFEAAEDAIISAFGLAGIRNIKKYNLGGFVQPGAVVPAILHGGSMGEVVAPVQTLMQMQRGGDIHVHGTWYVNAVDAKGVRDMVKSREFADAFVHVIRNNRHFLTSEVKKAL